MAEQINLEREHELFMDLFSDIFSFEPIKELKKEEEEEIVNTVKLSKGKQETLNRIKELSLILGKYKVRREDLKRDIAWERWKIESLSNEAFVPYDNRISFVGYLTWDKGMMGFVELNNHFYTQHELQRMYENDYERYEKLILDKNVSVINPGHIVHEQYLEEIPRRRRAAIEDMIKISRPDIIGMEEELKEIEKKIKSCKSSLDHEKTRITGEEKCTSWANGGNTKSDAKYTSQYYAYNKTCPHRQVNNLFYRSYSLGDIFRTIKRSNQPIMAHRLG